MHKNLYSIYYLLGVSETKVALETAKQAIDAADNALLVYSKEIDQIGLQNTVDELKSALFGTRFSVEDATIVGNITSQLMTGSDHFFMASQNVVESFGSAESLLNAYIKVLDRNDDTISAARKHLLLATLSFGITSLNKAQTELNKTSSEFKTIIEETSVLQARQKNESDEKSESIKRMCDHLRDTLNKISTDIDESNEKLKEKTQVIEDLKNQIEGATPIATTNDDAEFRDAFVQSAQKLIADYKEFRQKHLPRE